MKIIRMIFVLSLTGLLICGCENIFIEPAGNGKNTEDFEAAWKRVNDVYPFMEFKKIDWDSLYYEYLPRVEAARGDEFYTVLGELLAELKDGHVYYKFPGGGEVYPYYPERHFKDRHAYSPFVVRKYFDMELIVTESTSAEYQVLPENIGYVFLSDFHDKNFSNEFTEILGYLKDTKGLIIDIRQKRGGYLYNAQAVAARFITSPMAWPELYSLGEPVKMDPIQPQGPFTYSNPVVVLINGSTFSAGEVTTELLKNIPGITAVGDTTGGGSGISLNSTPATRPESELPGGIKISIPSGYMARYDGLPWERIGIPPDIRVQQTEEDIAAGRDRQLEYAINLLTGKSD